MNKINKILAVGDSITKGYGLKLEHNDPKLWINQLALKLNCSDVTNLSRTGCNNYWIFLEALSELVKNRYDLVIIGWSTIPRFYFNVGLETYSTHTKFDYGHDINLNNNLTITKKKLGKIGDELRSLHNDHWDYLDLIKYVNALLYVQHSINKGQIFFVNTLINFPAYYFNKKEITLPSDLTLYEQNLLSVNTRHDSEIIKLYNMIHDHYKCYGGIQEEYWLNLYDSFRHSHQIDTVSIDDDHPGYKSQEVFANHLYPVLKKKLNEASTINN